MTGLSCSICGATTSLGGTQFTTETLSMHMRVKHKSKGGPALPEPHRENVVVYGRDEDDETKKTEPAKDRKPICFCPVCGTNLKAVDDAVNP